MVAKRVLDVAPRGVPSKGTKLPAERRIITSRSYAESEEGHGLKIVSREAACVTACHRPSAMGETTGDPPMLFYEFLLSSSKRRILLLPILLLWENVSWLETKRFVQSFPPPTLSTIHTLRTCYYHRGTSACNQCNRRHALRLSTTEGLSRTETPQPQTYLPL